MSIAENNSYLIVDKEKNQIGEILSVKRVENWYNGKVKNLALPENLNLLFQEVEKHIKNHDFSASKKTEKEILGHQLQIKETGQIFSDIQLGFKEIIYFKLDN
jgi:hypothetical protein